MDFRALLSLHNVSDDQDDVSLFLQKEFLPRTCAFSFRSTNEDEKLHLNELFCMRWEKIDERGKSLNLNAIF